MYQERLFGCFFSGKMILVMTFWVCLVIVVEYVQFTINWVLIFRIWVQYLMPSFIFTVQLGKHLFEMCRFYMDIAQIALGKCGKKVLPTNLMSNQHIGTTDQHNASPASLATPQSPKMLQLWLEKEPIAIPQQRSYVASAQTLAQPQRRRRPRKETLQIPNLNVSLSLTCGNLASSSIFRASESWFDLQIIVMMIVWC